MPDLLLPIRTNNDMHSDAAVLATAGNNFAVCHLHDQLSHIVTPVLQYQHTSLIMQDVKHDMIRSEARQQYYMKYSTQLLRTKHCEHKACWTLTIEPSLCYYDLDDIIQRLAAEHDE